MDNSAYVETHQPNSYGMQPYPMVSGPPPPGQQTTVVVQSHQPMPSMAGWIALSCVVFWCCNCLFGAIAFFLAIAGLSARSPDEARHYGKVSMWLSISGIIISVIIAIIIVVLYATGAAFVASQYSSVNTNYYYNG